jgi:prepilin-type N-terminal cleavage/methylation domain-containing protein
LDDVVKIYILPLDHHQVFMAKNLIPAIHGVSSSLPTPARSPTLLLREASMRPPKLPNRGFTLIEVLLVLFIGAILVFAVARSISSQQKPAVQSLLDELEGTLVGVIRAQDLSPNNLQFETAGSWSNRDLEIEAVDGTNQLVVQKFLANGHSNWAIAGIDSDGSLVASALGGRPPLNSISPCNVAPWSTALANPFCNLVGTPTNSPTIPLLPSAAGKTVQLNAYNHQFVSSFCIPVVGLTNGQTYSGAPVGYVIVIGNRIYKFYSASPTDPWRRL